MSVSPQQWLSQLARMDQRYQELEQQLAQRAPQSHQDPKGYQELSRELADLKEVVGAYRHYRRVAQEAAEAEALAGGGGEEALRQLAAEEAVALIERRDALLGELIARCAAREEEPERPFLIEIRPGTGGLEASLFVADLYRMYTKYAARCGWSVEVMEGTRSEAGGFKSVALAIRGPGAWKRLQHERGVHRVQRVPDTEAQGRIHTSTVTVAVLPEPGEVELPPVPAKDLVIDVYRASGPGGQGVNTTDSAVRIRHVPTGLIVTCQDERSQLRNKDKAMRVLRARLLDKLQQDQQRQIASDRRKQVGTGDRSEKIRTYNFPDRRVTDHRIGLTLHRLEQILEGDLQELLEALETAARARRLEESP